MLGSSLPQKIVQFTGNIPSPIDGVIRRVADVGVVLTTVKLGTYGGPAVIHRNKATTVERTKVSG